MKTAFIGTGTMGGGMAANLRKSGAELTVVARRSEVREAFSALGCRVSAEIREAAACEVIFLCLPDEAAVEAVLFGEDGLFAGGALPGRIVADCSTISYKAAKAFAIRCGTYGASYLDAPVSGHKAKADAGTLTIMAGGEEAVFDKIEPLLRTMGTQILYMGPSGSGQLAKMINNCALNICTASFCELMPLGVKMGLSPEKLGEVLTTATGSSYASQTLIPKILDGDFSHGFTMEAAYKDMKNMAEAAAELAVPLPTLAGTMETYQLALLTGRGHLYKGAMIRFYEDLLGVKCRRTASEEEEI